MLKYRDWIIDLSTQSYPDTIVLELTTDCNLKCIHCFRNAIWDCSTGAMDKKTFSRLLEEIIKCNVERVVLSGWGEPLLHKEIINYIYELKEARVSSIALNTNGTLLSEYVDSLITYIDEFIISIDAVNKDLYRTIRQGDFSDVLNGIIKLNKYRIRKIMKPALTLLFTANLINIKELINVVKFAKNVGANKLIISNFIPISYETEDKLGILVKHDIPKLYDNIISEIAKLSMGYNILISIASYKPKVERLCPFISNNAVFIRFDGSVSPCLNYAHGWKFVLEGIPRKIHSVTYGNISNNDLDEIWRQYRYTQLRYNLDAGLFPSCLDCPTRKVCRYTLSNEYDCWGNNPTCAHCIFYHRMAICPI